MPYTKNPHMPKVRRDAADMVRRGFSKAEVGRRFGISDSTVAKWVKKAKVWGYHPIPTLSSRPKHHPKELSRELVWKIFHQRMKTRRCAEVIHEELRLQGVQVSLSSVKRTLNRSGLLKKRNPYKRYHPPVERPYPLKAGDLVEIDTIHLMTGPKTRIYVYVLIDVHSRWTYARACKKIGGGPSLQFVRKAEKHASFPFRMLQSDHGPEFGNWFLAQVQRDHRFTRIGKPNDNAHIERFNRTLQEECLDRIPKKVTDLNRALLKYLAYYNSERLHMGIAFKTPVQLLNPVQGID